ncbi:hypothetical protein EI94DRAFT_356482 [Lactarius quietus]|nr:hypothetical protein EI94DRAFT_356482 [Lactarius quietus]
MHGASRSNWVTVPSLDLSEGDRGVFVSVRVNWSKYLRTSTTGAASSRTAVKSKFHFKPARKLHTYASWLTSWSPKRKNQLLLSFRRHIQDVFQDLLVFAMMLYKPIVSLIVAFAAASSTAASATPFRRAGSGDNTPRGAEPTTQCNPINQQCCQGSPATGQLIFISCIPLAGSCSGTTACCDNNQNNGVNLASCSPISIL